MIRRLELRAAGLSAAAAVVHGLVAPEHLEEWIGYGAFFIAATVAQGGYAILLALQPWRYDATGELVPDRGVTTGRRIYLTGIAGNAAVVALYVVTRTIGVPLLGPDAGEVEAVTPISLVATLSEVMVLWLLVRLYRTTSPRPDGA